MSPYSPIRNEAICWSDLPRVAQHYLELSDKEGQGIGRLFSYASLIDNHKNEKPASSSRLPNEAATLPGMEVAMNVLAVGREYRGASGTYNDAEGQEKYFANSGLYAGLEPTTSKDGYASGMNITTTPEDRIKSLKAYINRELGNPPETISLDDIFDPRAASKFEALKGTPQDKFHMYKFQIVNAAIKTEDGANRRVPAITVSTNENSRFSAMGLSPMQAAERILDGQGYRRKEGDSIMGGSALDYFKNKVLGVARKFGLYQPRLEAINTAIDTLANILGEMGDIQNSSASNPQKEALINACIERHRTDLVGLSSPLFGKNESTNHRTITPDDLELPENKTIPHTWEEKFQRIAALRDADETKVR